MIKYEIGVTSAVTTPTEQGFEAVFAIASLLAVAYLVLRQKK
jgi:PGF-CTERM protein